MEIEAKFGVPDETTLQRLAQADELAGYRLQLGEVKRMHDVFLDTPDRKILASGHVCRQRDFGDFISMTLKSGGTVQGAIHSREELMLTLPRIMPPREWPDSELRSAVLKLIGDDDLTALFDQRQVRVVRSVTQADRVVGEFSADRVELSIGNRQRVYFEVEIELKEAGTLADLELLAACLTNEWGLRAEPRSKFERALAFSSETN